MRLPLTFPRILRLLPALAVCAAGCEFDSAPLTDVPLPPASKADSAGIVDGTSDAGLVLLVANKLDAAVLFDAFEVGLTTKAAGALDAYRKGDDGVECTEDDEWLESILELDRVPFYGPLAFALMLDYAQSVGRESLESMPSRCFIPPDCVPKRCSTSVRSCGPLYDGCGNTRDCGGCTAPFVCGGNGTPNACELPGSVSVPAGSFVMGCADSDADCATDKEGPSHRVSLAAYEIEKTEVTRGAYQRCVDAGWCVPVPPAQAEANAKDLPVTDVTWPQARAYCHFIGMRLPTEAEWERAARGDHGRTYPWGEKQPDCERAHFDECGETLREVGSLPRGASRWGARNMAGNVAEWVNDLYASSYYFTSPPANPTGPTLGWHRVVRGGSTESPASGIRAAARAALFPNTRSALVGFRCAFTVE